MVETLKVWVLEAGRVLVLGGLSAVITWALNLANSGLLANALPLTPELNAAIVGLLTTALKAADRAIHESKEIKLKGIVPF